MTDAETGDRIDDEVGDETDDETRATELRRAWANPTVEEVTAGVYRLPLPLPDDALRAVNVYVLEGRDGLTLIDGGWAQAASRTQLDRSLQVLGTGAHAIRRIFVTHAHRDHYTLAVVLRREFGMPIALGAGERDSIVALTSPDRAASFASQTSLLRAAGAPELAALMEAQAEYVDPVRDGWELPDQWLEAGTVSAGDSTLSVVPTPGHTRGHVVFADTERALLFSGDHILPHITPSIGLETVASPSPLSSFLDSLALVQTLPDLRLLPAHGPVAASSHARVQELLDHHDDRLAKIRALAATGQLTAAQIARQLTWTRRGLRLTELDDFNQTLAIGETVAHLTVLERAGLVVGTSRDGVVSYHAAAAAAADPAASS